RKQLSWLLRSWLAWGKLVRPTVSPADADPEGLMSENLRKPFEKDRAASDPQVKAALDAVLASPAAKKSLYEFIARYYAFILCGLSWQELGVQIPLPQAPTTPPLVIAHETLKQLPRSSETWLVAYAGCPLGRPARVYPLE